ncbi:hypothetical protein GINT2_002250 [Glugoides intestinalis]
MQNNIILQLVKTTPPITRILVFLTVSLSLLVHLDIVKQQQISYSRFYLQHLEFHRIFTTFFYYGKTSFELLMNFVFLYKYSSVLEESYSRTSDYLFIIMIIFILLIITSSIFYIPFLATVLANTITYIWTRKNPLAIVQIFGFISFSAFYLPFVFPIVSLIFDKTLAKDDLVGIFVGHIVFYFTEVYPKFGKRVLKTPCILHKLFKEECSSCTKKKQGRKLMSFIKPVTLSVLEENREIVPRSIEAVNEPEKDISEEDAEERSYNNIESEDNCIESEEADFTELQQEDDFTELQQEDDFTELQQEDDFTELQQEDDFTELQQEDDFTELQQEDDFTELEKKVNIKKTKPDITDFNTAIKEPKQEEECFESEEVDAGEFCSHEVDVDEFDKEITEDSTKSWESS